MKSCITKCSILCGGIILGCSLDSLCKKINIIKAEGATLIPQKFTVPFQNYQLPSSSNVKVFHNYIVSYNRRTKNPEWALELLTPSLVGSPSDKPDYRKDMKFEFDETEPPHFRVLPQDYNNSGYDRGHLAAAANYKNDEEDCRRSFLMSNICPQVGENFNRGIWNKLEMFTRALARKSEFVFVCTGPLYLPRPVGTKKYVHYEVISDKDVAVPTHFFKVLLIKEQGVDRFKLFSYVLPNEAVKDTTDFHIFYVPLSDIERAAGFFIFSQILRNLRFSQINENRYG